MNNLDMNSPMKNFFNPEGRDDASEGVSARGYGNYTENDSASGASISKRREYRMQKNRIRRIVLITLSIIIGIFLALAATDVIKLGTGPRPSLEGKSIVKKNITITQL